MNPEQKHRSGMAVMSRAPQGFVCWRLGHLLGTAGSVGLR